MDNFDQHITDAKKEYEPRKDFVDMTMQQVRQTQPKKKWGMRLWVPTAAVGAAVVIAAILFIPTLNHSNTASTKVATPTTSTANQTAPTTSTTPAVPAGTDNASLDSDMNGVNSSMSQESSDQTSADSAVNDSSQEVTVPSS
jgi:negative regulator of sigma E activity